ncbi:MAG: GlcNAc-PI de-N-acetylase [Candidatus Nephthysia bennettiae]|uniref:PIG-L family deacetylase n=1 Tax=Candidatus Nephthysia bennettiae TaxID=3127016 RepID=A0A934K8F4_9BACT|nr:PIG-L family deacetylase [Candidatus Dormibacteraeota bacterium]MBJ7611548.1 PIG-L family deacetylase [Candidatus Dormibacteraeota bacterium]PZS00271.1 MAG: GlcNAc-PI de-N-acetylase [Candidatus Dormibacteraeota bacterium]
MATLFLVHAHPDDEAVSTGGVMMRAHEAGHRVVLVTATRGEEGEIYNMDEAESRPRLAEIRAEELRRADEILGVDRQEFLGYRDSGMAGVPSNQDPASFHMAPLHEAAERLAALLREERPEVVVTYASDGTYGHPDHVKAHHVTVAALDLLAAEGWEPAAVYFHVIPRGLVEKLAERWRESGLPEPTIQVIGTPDEEITATVDVRDIAHRKREAFSAHLSQNNPDSPFQTMGDQIFESAFGYESFVLARGGTSSARTESDLFAGIR